MKMHTQLPSFGRRHRAGNAYHIMYIIKSIIICYRNFSSKSSSMGWTRSPGHLRRTAALSPASTLVHGSATSSASHTQTPLQQPLRRRRQVVSPLRRSRRAHTSRCSISSTSAGTWRSPGQPAQCRVVSRDEAFGALIHRSACLVAQFPPDIVPSFRVG